MSVFTNSSASHSADQAREYTAAVLALLGDRDPLDVLRSTPDAARHIVAGLSESELSRPEAERKWSLRQVIRHLADSAPLPEIVLYLTDRSSFTPLTAAQKQ